MTATPTPAAESAIPWREMFRLDLRSLALFRVALAVLVLLDWIDRIPDLAYLFTDAGVVPRAAISGTHPFSFHMLDGSLTWAWILTILSLACAAALLVGYRTTLATLLCWFLLLGAHTRCPVVLQGGDHLLRMMLFWGIFLPLGARWSVDAARQEHRPASDDWTSAATVAYLLQICQVYWYAAGWKWLGPWREEGTAVSLALQVDHFTTRVGLALRSQPWLCTLATHATIWLETLGPVALLLPFHVGAQRLLTCAAFILFHAGLALTMELGHFPFVGMCAWLPLLPAVFWDKLPRVAWVESLADRVSRLPGTPPASTPARWRPPAGPVAATVVVFCAAYVAATNFATYLNTKLPQFDPEAARRYVPLFPRQVYQFGNVVGLEQGWGLFAPQPGRYVGWYVVTGTRPDGSEIDILHGGGPVGWAKPDLLAATYPNGRTRKLWMNLAAPEDAPYLLPGFTSYHLLEWNKYHPDAPVKDVAVYWMREVTVAPGEERPAPEKVFLGRYTLQQEANPATTGLMLAVGTRRDKAQIDLLRGGVLLDWTKPDPTEAARITDPSAALLFSLLGKDVRAAMVPAYARHRLEAWNREHPVAERVESLDIVWLPEPAPDGGPASKARREVFASAKAGDAK